MNNNYYHSSRCSALYTFCYAVRHAMPSHVKTNYYSLSFRYYYFKVIVTVAAARAHQIPPTSSWRRVGSPNENFDDKTIS